MREYANKRILVTGGAGFLGSHLCEQLLEAADGRVVSNFIVQALKNQPITLYGDGAQTRSFCYVDDLIGGLIVLMDSAPTLTGPLNLGNPREFSMRQLAETVLALTGSKPLPTDDPKQRKPDIKAAQQQLGWMPRVELTEGLIHTIAYFEQLLGVKKRNIKPTPLLGKPGQPLVAGRSYAGGS